MDRTSGPFSPPGTLLDEHVRVVGRDTWYETVDDMQKDLDVFLVEYDEKRPNQGGNIARHDPYGRIQEGLESRPTKESQTPQKTAA